MYENKDADRLAGRYVSATIPILSDPLADILSLSLQSVKC